MKIVYNLKVIDSIEVFVARWVYDNSPKMQLDFCNFPIV
jgi:hypothetical protein